MSTSYNLLAYCIYLPVTLLLTWYVATKLFRNAKVFMLDIFHGKTDIAESTNNLFETGFYLLNAGFAFLVMEISYDLFSTQGLFEVLSAKIGGFCIYLGLMLFLNLWAFFRGRKVSKSKLAAANIERPVL